MNKQVNVAVSDLTRGVVVVATAINRLWRLLRGCEYVPIMITPQVHQMHNMINCDKPVATWTASGCTCAAGGDATLWKL